jgi:hypothetical protein
MTMSFLAPLFLLGIVAIALPFWLHRLQAQSSERRSFSSAMLLETAEQQVHVGRKLKYLVLLALRVVLLTLIALAFAKPFLSSPPDILTPTASGSHLIVVDTSASMSRNGAFDQATDLARRAIDSTPGDALLQVLSAADSLRVESALSVDRGTHRAALSAIAPGTQRLDFGLGMAELDRIAEALPPPVTLHLISDFQSTGMPARFSDLAAAHIAELVAYRVEFGALTDRRIDFVRERDSGLDVGVAGEMIADQPLQVELILNDSSVDRQSPITQDLAVIHFAELQLETGDNRAVVRINASDDYAADDQRYYVIENIPPSPVPLLTADLDGLPVTYLSAALQSDPAGRFIVEPMLTGQFDPRVLARYRWIVVDDLGSLSTDLSLAISNWVHEGGNLLAFAGSRMSAMEQLPVTGHTIRATAGALPNKGFLTVGRYDSKHPLLAKTDGWHNVRLNTSLPIDAQSDDEILIRLENEHPLLLERALGNGRILLMTAGLENTDNDLPTRPVFVSFTVEAARYLSGTSTTSKSFVSGDWLLLSLVGGTSGQLTGPSGETLSSLADTTRIQRIRLDQPGFYEVYTSQGEYFVAVNVDARESHMEAISSEALDNWSRSMSNADVSGTTAALEAEAAQVELWPWLLLLLMLVVIIESVLGNSYLSPRATVS